MTRAIAIFVTVLFVNGLMVRLEITGIPREFARLSVLGSLGYLIYILIRSKRK